MVGVYMYMESRGWRWMGFGKSCIQSVMYAIQCTLQYNTFLIFVQGGNA